MQPWHMQLTFDLRSARNLTGNGTIEEWWAAPDRVRVVITSLSLNETLPGTSVVTNGREAYLVHAVRQWTYRPYRPQRQIY
jgi:hypothetical protein